MDYAQTKQLAIDLEHFITPEWAIKRLLEKEILTRLVFDPCVGTGVLARAAADAGYHVSTVDIHDWGYGGDVQDFLQMPNDLYGKEDFTVLMNPPFSKATEFVEKSFEMGARKIVMFQRFSFWESRSRREFWDKYPPVKVYICGDRASCWRFDIPEGDRKSGTTTAHAWFIFEAGHKGGTLMERLYRD